MTPDTWSDGEMVTLTDPAPKPDDKKPDDKDDKNKPKPDKTPKGEAIP